MSHIEKSRNVWFATLKVPPELHEQMGRTKFKQTLGTTDKRKAQQLAPPVVAGWKAQIRAARGEPNAVETEALRWRAALAAVADPEERAQLDTILTSRAESMEERKGAEVAQQFAAVALGVHTPSGLHFDDWAASRVHLEQKTQDQAKKDVQILIAGFSALELITPQAVRKWAQTLKNSKDGSPLSASSISRMVSFWRSYWGFLVKREAVPAGVDPFALVERPVISKKAAASAGWVPFHRDDVPRLVAAALAREDQELADLITLGAYTGARIEELCSLKVESIGDLSFKIDDAKTAAGVREVPIHAALVPLLQRLKGKAATLTTDKEARSVRERSFGERRLGKPCSGDGFLLSGLTLNKYGDRSNAIGKRFGRLKTVLGYGDQYVFHSLRKTLVTLLEDAGVSENLAADIVGHEKPRITYGLYSGGASLETKAAALALVSYPGM